MSPSCAKDSGQARVELDAFGDQVEGFVVSAARLRHHRLPVIGPIRRGLFFKHAIELFLRPIEISPRILRQRIQRRLGQRHAHAQQGLRKLGLAPKCFLEQRQLFGDVLAAGTAEMDGQSSHQEISDGRLARARFRRLSGFRKGHGDLHAPRDAGCNLILRRRASDILPLEAVRPDLHAIGSVDQLNIDDGARSLAPDPASYDVSNPELVPDRGDIHAPRPISEGGLVRNHPEPAKSGKGVVEIFGQGAGEVSNCRIGAVAAGNRQQENGHGSSGFHHRGATGYRAVGRRRQRIRIFKP